MERYIAYRVERIDDSTPSVWILSGHIYDQMLQCIGNFNSQSDAFEILERISGIRGVDGLEYYPVEPPVHVVSARLHVDGISETLVPYETTENTPLAADADEDEQLLFMVKATQAFFWRALNALESQLGFEIDSSQDFQEASIDYLKSTPGAPV